MFGTGNGISTPMPANMPEALREAASCSLAIVSGYSKPLARAEDHAMAGMED